MSWELSKTVMETRMSQGEDQSQEAEVEPPDLVDASADEELG